MERLPMEFKGKKGFMYFFKVKPKKDDGFWKIGTVGMVPENANEFEFEKEDGVNGFTLYPPLSSLADYGAYSEFDFTRITETKIKEDEPLNDQLNKILKKLLYSKRKSAAEFYTTDDEDGIGKGGKDLDYGY